MTNDAALPPHAVAVIGFAGRFPGAPDAEALFANLCAGREGVTFFREDELDPSIPAALRDDPDYRRARGILTDCDRFDAEFFGILPAEAEVMDPQHRLLLELSWTALESSAHRPGDCRGRIGVFLGAQWSHYLRNNVMTRADVIARFGEGNVTIANEQDFLATRISYKLGLRGPSFTVATACSTSLVAIAQAARSLIDGECDLALAGGASIVVPVRSGYRHDPGGMLSADGHCRPFDRDATGTTFGDGAGVVVLRRLADALADGDPIHAVVRGFAVNNDGDDKVSFTAPSIAGQADVLAAALAHAGVDPHSVGYVEAHGTATPMGDPIEFAALARAYRGLEPGAPPCVVGSVKSSVGHLVHAAGVAGFLTAAFAVRDGVLPPTLHFQEPNPRLSLERSRFRVASRMQRWPGDRGPRRAGVSSFGVGGTNAHVVLQEPPALRAVEGDAGPQWLRLSARTPAALQGRIDDLRQFLSAAEGELRLADVAFTLDVGRVAMAHRAAVRADSIADAVLALADSRRLRRGEATGPREVALQFPGHGVQRVGMARWLHAAFPESRDRIEAGIAIVRRRGGPDLRAALLGGADGAGLDDVFVAHPALLVCECALADALHALGLRPAAVLGCSLGEFAAATVAGVMSFEDALAAVMASGEAIVTTAPGAMFTACCSETEARRLAGDVAIAAVYDADAVVLSGPTHAAAAARERLERAGVRTAPLRAEHGFHSPLMETAALVLEQVFASVPLHAPQVPFFSAAAGGELSPELAQSPRHWAEVLCAAVRYRDAVAALEESGDHVLVEAGPGVGLTALALQRRRTDGATPVAALPGSGVDAFTIAELHAVVAHCWANGVEEAAAVPPPACPRRLMLPTHRFARTRHWLEPGVVAPTAIATEVAAEGASCVEGLDARLMAILEGASGQSVSLAEQRHWSELGFDSLVATQVAIGVRRQFGVELGFRDLMERLTCPQALCDWLAAAAPVPQARPSVDTASVTVTAAPKEGAAPQRPNPGARIERTVSDRHRTSPEQQQFLASFCADYARRTARSKAFAQEHRRHLADPRTVTGFHPSWKEIVYPIVTERSRGSRLWDLDGNEYVDMLNGFGSILFGHSPDFLTEAVREQLERGIEIGPQSALAGEVAQLFCELTGNERVGFANTGSEAVTAALRIARTVTGRDKVVMFEGAYHGIFDEVLARPAFGGGVSPASPGVPHSHVAEMIVLPYGAPSSLEVIASMAGQLAAVLVEPVQGRNPNLQPREFLHSLREITRQNGCALILDEVVTGFRSHPGGIQALFGIDADIALYGKVVAGGHPIGLVAGKARFLDALDGGFWSYGDDSVPEVGVTFFAGTFVRHPIALAAARATLRRIKEEGPALQDALAERTRAMIRQIEQCLLETGVGIHVESFRSAFYLSVKPSEPWGSLLFAMLRHRGIHIWEQFPCFLTTSHTDADCAVFVRHFRESIEELQRIGLMSPPPARPRAAVDKAPIAGARLGQRADGTLAWFVADPERPGKYREIADAELP